MIIVTNKIKVKSGLAEKMAPRFTQQGPLQEMEGFVKVEVSITQNLTEYDELNVSMYWNTMEDFNRWKESDIFKEAHKGPKKSEESPVIDNEITIAEVAATLEGRA